MDPRLLISLGVIVVLLLAALLFRRTRLLSVCPRVIEGDEGVIARTSLKGFILSLTLLYRLVVIDPRRQAVEIRRRLFWFFKTSRSIRFDHVDKILYSYEDWSMTSALDVSGDTLDCYSVKLRLLGGGDVHLFRFFGEGGFQRGVFYPWESWLPDWFYFGDRLFDMSGTQEADSQRFIELLESYTGASVSPG